jgi:hypothetical protein
MHYKTIVLSLLEQKPELHDRLRRERKLLQTMNACAAELKLKHMAWMDTLWAARPESDPSQLTSKAMELAIDDLRASMKDEFSTDAL